MLQLLQVGAKMLSPASWSEKQLATLHKHDVTGLRLNPAPTLRRAPNRLEKYREKAGRWGGGRFRASSDKHKCKQNGMKPNQCNEHHLESAWVAALQRWTDSVTYIWAERGECQGACKSTIADIDYESRKCRLSFLIHNSLMLSAWAQSVEMPGSVWIILLKLNSENNKNMNHIILVLPRQRRESRLMIIWYIL